jgi:hypothetical protein
MIEVNKQAQKKHIDDTYKIVLKTIKDLANDGQNAFTIHMSLPNFEDGHEVFDRLRKEGISVFDRGFESFKNPNGSYSFTVSCFCEM